MVTDLEWDILQTVAYADIFDYPMTHAEIHRYLIGREADIHSVNMAIAQLIGRYVADCGGYICLMGREHIVQTRLRRAEIAKRLWGYAEKYGGMVGRLPFVQMVAVTGSLAVDNTDKEGDIDLLIITSPGRLWLCRLLVIGVVKRGIRRDGITLCPNYFISTNALTITDQNPFTARELAQMVPIAGMAMYDQFRAINNWSYAYFPNAITPPQRDIAPSSRGMLTRLAEWMLRTPLGAMLEAWEMRRKIKKLTAGGVNRESEFSADMCKGHFDGHRARILSAYDQRLRLLQVAVGGD